MAKDGGLSGEAARPAMDPAQNHLLGVMEREVLARLGGELEPAELSVPDVIYRPGQVLDHVFFPVSGVFSMVNPLAGGRVIEVATIGREGFVGVPVFLGSSPASFEVFCQVPPGRGYRMGAEAFRRAADASAGFRRVLLRFTQAMFTQIGQTAACNRAHEVHRRCARWLLMTQDRVETARLPLSHEFLGHMLGTGREEAAGVVDGLVGDGLVEHGPGVITVKDRQGLERASCECYGVIRREYDRLLGA